MGAWMILNPIAVNKIVENPPKNNSSWIFVIILFYVFGYSVLSIGERIILPITEKIKEKTPGKHRDRNSIKRTIQSKPIFTIAINRICKVYKFTQFEKDEINTKEDDKFNFWRNLSLSITQENNTLVYRFTSIALLNLGTATSLISLDILWLLVSLSGKLIPLKTMNINWIVFIVSIIFAYFFLDVYYAFYRRSMEIPFGLAVVKLHDESNK
jgi:hypothetical protein